MNDERVETARRAARAGAAVAEGLFRTDLVVETKSGKTDVVTRADQEAQDAVVEVIRETYPDDALVGEEEDTLDVVPAEGTAWVIDPIDGTNNYVRGLHVWATSVAAVVDGDPVAAATVSPTIGDEFVAWSGGARRNGDPIAVSERTDPETFSVAPTIWWAFDRRDEYAAACRAIVERFGDMRRFGSAQATLAMIAAGSLEATITNVDANSWDTIAGAYLVERAGGVVTGLEGEPWNNDTVGLVASNGTRHDEVLAAAREIADVARG